MGWGFALMFPVPEVMSQHSPEAHSVAAAREENAAVVHEGHCCNAAKVRVLNLWTCTQGGETLRERSRERDSVCACVCVCVCVRLCAPTVATTWSCECFRIMSTCWCEQRTNG